MSLRIVSGKFGGRVIKTSDDLATHPMGDRVRMAMFNIIGDRIKQADVLDIFAGSGSLGIEAISRGANKATFVDSNQKAKNIIVENITTLDIDNQTKVMFMEADRYIRENQSNSYDIIFVDPPYNDLQLSTVSKLVSLLKSNGLMVLSYPGKGGAPTVDGIVVVDNRSYGKAQLAFYQKK